MRGVKRALLSSVSKNVLYANLTTGVLPSWLVHTWGATPTSPPYYFDASDNLQTAPNNLIRNSTMLGATTGTPGAIPTNWSYATVSGVQLTNTVVSSVTGVPTIDLTFAGTPTATGNISLSFDTNNAAPASMGQTWMSSVTFSLSGGSVAGTTGFTLLPEEYSAGGGWLANSTFAFTPTATPVLVFGTRTLSSTTVAYFNTYVGIGVANGTPVNFTLRISSPQASLITPAQTTPSPFMPTTGSAYYGPVVNDHNPSTLAALGLRSEPQRTNLFLANLAPATQTIAVASGTTYTVSFYGTGSIVLSGAATHTMAGAAGVRTQYSFTAGSTSLTATVSGLSATSYAQTEANPFATSPILTYGAAVTVPADNWAFTGVALAQLISGSACLVIEGCAENIPANSYWFSVDDGTFNNRIYGQAYSVTQQYAVSVLAGSVTLAAPPVGGDLTTGKRRLAMSWRSVGGVSTYDGSAPATWSTANPTGLTEAGLGNTPFASTPWVGWFSQIMICPSCTAAQVQAFSTVGANLRQ